MLLLLAGSGEARKIAAGLAQANIPAISSLAGVTRSPTTLALPTRFGGFGGRDGFIAYLAQAGITAILDATHPFACQISMRTAQIADELNIPYLQFLRPEWQPGAGDQWVMLDSEKEAAKHIPPGARVFLATGRQTLGQYSNLVGRTLTCRQIDPPDTAFPFPNGQFLVGRPPFSVQDELSLFKKLSIDWLVVKNAGGEPSRTKLDAARALNIPVGMIRRPQQPPGAKAERIAPAVEWAQAQAQV